MDQPITDYSLFIDATWEVALTQAAGMRETLKSSSLTMRDLTVDGAECPAYFVIVRDPQSAGTILVKTELRGEPDPRPIFIPGEVMRAL